MSQIVVRRPRLDARDDPRREIVMLRLSLVERALLVRAAEVNRQTLADFIRGASQEAAGDCLDLDSLSV